MKTTGILFLIVAFLTSCNVSSKDEKKELNSYALEEVWATDTVLKTPESVLYDSIGGVVYVSNVNMSPWEADSNGFISKIDLNGNITDLEWVTGLDSPKGMGVRNGILYVTDISKVVEIDVSSGTIVHSIPAQKGDRLNDISVSHNGEIFVSASGGNKVYKIENDGLVEYLSMPDAGPNGVYAGKDSLIVLTSGTHKLFSVNYMTQEATQLTEGLGHADGVVPVGDGGYLVSDWSGGLFYVNEMAGLDTLNYTSGEKFNTADIEYVQSENLLMVPTFFDNRVVAYQLKKVQK